jgi:mannosyltransferase OCH1-like enzyme
MKNNVLLYWDKFPFPESVVSVSNLWKSLGDDWNVELFCFDSALSFLEKNFGERVSSAFMSCAIPAMQSDFIRVFWILKNGGLYADITFAPGDIPKFWHTNDKFVCARWQHGRIINGIFYSEPGSETLVKISEDILQNVQSRAGRNIRNITGPGVWNNIISSQEITEYRVIDRADLFRKHIRHSKYSDSTRDSDLHWSKIQHNIDIFRDL